MPTNAEPVGERDCRPRPRWGWAGAILSIWPLPTALAEPVNLDRFIGGIENRCRLSEPLETFRRELNARYSYEEGVRRLRSGVNLPPWIRPAVGAAQPTQHGDHTEIVVPLAGTYRGLPLRSIAFAVGHSNGISVTTLAFGVPAEELKRAIGLAVDRTQQDFDTDPEQLLFRFSARIISSERGSALVCDTST